MKYTESQLEIIHHLNGPALVIACPGSGKTTTVIGRINYMVNEYGVEPYTILAVTFTKAAADSMKNKYESQDGAKAGVSFSTIHSLCYSALAASYHLTPNQIISEYDVSKFFEKIIPLARKNRDMKKYIKHIITLISYVRNADMDYRAYVPNSDQVSQEEFIRYYEKYKGYKETSNKLDFDDMIIQTRDLFKFYPQILEYWQDRFPYIIIDEFQDTNAIQAEIFEMLARKYQNICVVGDDDQSIYGFRSADSSIMLNFEKEYENCARYSLDVNYRSCKNVVSAASKFIETNQQRFKKKFLGHIKKAGSIKFIHFANGENDTEAIRVRKEVERLIRSGEKPEDIAVLYRNNILITPTISEFVLNAIPYNVKDQVENIYTDVAFRDIRTYYRVANQMDTPEEYKKILNRPKRFLGKAVSDGIPKYDYDKLLSNCHKAKNEKFAIKNVMKLDSMIGSLKTKDPKHFFSVLLREGYLDCLTEDYAEFTCRSDEELKAGFKMLYNEAVQFGDMEKWLEHGEIVAKKISENSEKKEGVNLVTFHSSKGLEWKHVLIIGFEHGVVPSKRAKSVEEERRLFYVAMTRAMESLTIFSHSDARMQSLFYLELQKIIEKTKRITTKEIDRKKNQLV